MTYFRGSGNELLISYLLNQINCFMIYETNYYLSVVNYDYVTGVLTYCFFSVEIT